MKVLIKVHYMYNTIPCFQKGVFLVNYRDYKKDPNSAAASSASTWIKEIMKSFPEMEIEEVL